jgi:hypothetical protein
MSRASRGSFLPRNGSVRKRRELLHEWAGFLVFVIVLGLVLAEREPAAADFFRGR